MIGTRNLATAISLATTFVKDGLAFSFWREGERYVFDQVENEPKTGGQRVGEKIVP